MNSRNLTVVLVALLLLAGAWFYRPSRPTAAAPSASSTHPPGASAPGTAPSNQQPSSIGVAQAPPIGPALAPRTTNIPAGTVLPPSLEGASALAMRQLDQINRMFRDYRTLFGSNPVGTNAEMMKAIMGGNPKKARLGPPEGMSLNENGELVDPWGTPFFFHQLSGEHMEIRSAGQDKRMWTPDDLVWK